MDHRPSFKGNLRHSYEIAWTKEEAGPSDHLSKRMRSHTSANKARQATTYQEAGDRLPQPNGQGRRLPKWKQA
ncbi:hypothetical protein JCGZ_16663 [Jatropha curcas]|uniref:Uncharacterized protein n=1 Tax=Jatropha curcas TaxID=180498 RepID=A0A067KEY8_JATCU|nr:hypothetical protein JCGZ_16663 [Jatropha curcas]